MGLAARVFLVEDDGHLRRLSLARYEQEKEVRLAMEVLPPISGEESLQVIDARHHFAKKSYDDRYRWKPSPDIQAAIIAATLGQNTA